MYFSKAGYLFTFFLLAAAMNGLLSTVSQAEPGLLRSVWSCHFPCVTKGNRDLIGSIEVSYCGVTAMSPAMIDSLNPVCQAKTKQPDAIAARSESASVAHCNSSSNPCKTDGLMRSGFTCSYRCPSEDPYIRKYTACAVTDDEAWSYAKQLCKDATPPDSSYFPPSHVCRIEGQTPCD